MNDIQLSDLDLVDKCYAPHDLGLAMLKAVHAGEVEAYEPPLEHYFADGLYGRRIRVKAGSCVVTCRHEQQHLTVALSGRCTVVDDKGNRQEIEAPGVWVTQPGTQRSVYCHTDVEWLTVHGTSLDTLEDIEAALVTDTLKDFKRDLALEVTV